MMRRINLILAGIFIIGCGSNTEIPDKAIENKVKAIEQTGIKMLKEYWPNGVLKASGKSRNDTIYGWFSFYDSLGFVCKKKEYYIDSSGQRILNQIISYSNGKIDYDSSLFVESYPMSDTINANEFESKMNFRLVSGDIIRSVANIKYNSSKGYVSDTVRSQTDILNYTFHDLKKGYTKVKIEFYPHISIKKGPFREVVREIYVDKYIYW